MVMPISIPELFVLRRRRNGLCVLRTKDQTKDHSDCCQQTCPKASFCDDMWLYLHPWQRFTSVMAA